MTIFCNFLMNLGCNQILLMNLCCSLMKSLLKNSC